MTAINSSELGALECFALFEPNMGIQKVAKFGEIGTRRARRHSVGELSHQARILRCSFSVRFTNSISPSLARRGRSVSSSSAKCGSYPAAKRITAVVMRYTVASWLGHSHAPDQCRRRSSKTSAPRLPPTATVFQAGQSLSFNLRSSP